MFPIPVLRGKKKYHMFWADTLGKEIVWKTTDILGVYA